MDPVTIREQPVASDLPRLDGMRALVLLAGAELFGHERANLEVLRAMSKLGLQVRFIISGKWGGEQIQSELKRSGFEWTTAPYGYLWGKSLFGRRFPYLFVNLFGVLSTSWRVWREARRWKATHLYTGSWLHLSFAAPAVAFLKSALVYRAGDEIPSHTTVHRWYRRWLVRHVTVLACNCRFLESRFRPLAKSATQLKVIYNFPPLSVSNQAAVIPKVAVNRVLVLYVGQVTEHKGVPVLVDAVDQLLKRNLEVTLWIVGASVWGNEISSKLQAQVEAAGWSEYIRFMGYRSDVANLMRAADLHVCPSIWEEPSPNVIFEAKREGIPSVVFPVGGIPELVEHCVDGYVCRECSADALARGIEFFVADPVRRKLAGNAARTGLAERFGSDRFCRQWAEVFIEANLKSTNRALAGKY